MYCRRNNSGGESRSIAKSCKASTPLRMAQSNSTLRSWTTFNAQLESSCRSARVKSSDNVVPRLRSFDEYCRWVNANGYTFFEADVLSSRGRRHSPQHHRDEQAAKAAVNDLKQRVNDRPRQVCDVRQTVQCEVRGQPQKKADDGSGHDASADGRGANSIAHRVHY